MDVFCWLNVRKSFISALLCKKLQHVEIYYKGVPKKLNIPKLEKPQKQISAKQIALVALFAALYVIVSIIPVPAIPTTAGAVTISLSALLASIFGLLLGPYFGGASALLGSAVSWALTGGSPYGLPFIIAPLFNALIVGFIFYRQWKYAFAVFGIMIIGFLFTPAVSPITGASTVAGVGNWWIAVAVLFDKVIALLLILPIAFFGKKISIAHGAALFFLIGFVGNQADNMIGTFIYSWPTVYNGIFGLTTEYVQASFLVSPFFYPAIRLIQAFFVMIIAIPLMTTLKGSTWLWRKENILTDKLPKTQTDSTIK
jgi:uncharacterized membrane protein